MAGMGEKQREKMGGGENSKKASGGELVGGKEKEGAKEDERN